MFVENSFTPYVLGLGLSRQIGFGRTSVYCPVNSAHLLFESGDQTTTLFQQNHHVVSGTKPPRWDDKTLM